LHTCTHQNHLVAFARFSRKVQFKLVLFTVKFFAIGGTIALYGDVGPLVRIFGIDLQPFVEPWFGVGFYGFSGALGLTYTAIDALIRVYNEHIFAFIKAVHGTYFYTVHIFALNAVIDDDIGHFTTPAGLFFSVD
jgi:hypothetical protein